MVQANTLEHGPIPLKKKKKDKTVMANECVGLLLAYLEEGKKES